MQRGGAVFMLVPKMERLRRHESSRKISFVSYLGNGDVVRFTHSVPHMNK
jgi:hypothetical protein